MQYTCTLSGMTVSENEGVLWKDMRAPVRHFLKGIRADWTEDSFISFVAYRKALQEYVATLAAEEMNARRDLKKGIAALKDTDIKETEAQDALVPPLTFGQRLADRIAAFGGSWPFIIIFLSFIVVWMCINTLLLRQRGYDPYPYILLNLILSCLAALQAPVIMMSQNRTEQRDRKRAEYDYEVNKKAEMEIRMLHEKIDHLLVHQHQHLLQMMDTQMELMQQMQTKSTQ